jgi:hypothetical protein
MPQYASGTLAEGVSNFCSSECERELASFCHCIHRCWNGDDVVLAGLDRSTVGDALRDSTRCLLTEGNLANEICRTVDA